MELLFLTSVLIFCCIQFLNFLGILLNAVLAFYYGFSVPGVSVVHQTKEFSDGVHLTRCFGAISFVAVLLFCKAVFDSFIRETPLIISKNVESMLLSQV